MQHEETKQAVSEVIRLRPLSEVKGAERPEMTEQEIEAWVMEELEADRKTLDLLATL